MMTIQINWSYLKSLKSRGIISRYSGAYRIFSFIWSPTCTIELSFDFVIVITVVITVRKAHIA